MSFVHPLKKICCPFCNKAYHPRDYSIISQVNPGTELYVSRLKRQAGAARSGWASRFWVKSPVAYTGEYACYACPHCNSTLPPNINRVEDNITIAIAGDVYSGKSHYIAALIDQLKKLSIPGKYFETMPASSDIGSYYEREFFTPLFKLERPLQPTLQAQNSLALGLIYEIALGDDAETAQRFNLLFYDVNGEDVVDPIRMARLRSHLLNARAIIFLADPWAMQESGFVQHLPHHRRPTVTPSRTATEALQWVVRTFKDVRPDLVHENVFPLPVAIAIPKCDLIEQHALAGNRPEYERLWDTSQAGLYNTDSQYMDKITRQFLYDIGEQTLLNVSRGFRSAAFFTVSATGSSPELDQNNQEKYMKGVKPFRCLDPLLWVLQQLDVLRS